jgi:hypothetical protein
MKELVIYTNKLPDTAVKELGEFVVVIGQPEEKGKSTLTKTR